MLEETLISPRSWQIGERFLHFVKLISFFVKASVIRDMREGTQNNEVNCDKHCYFVIKMDLAALLI